MSRPGSAGSGGAFPYSGQPQPQYPGGSGGGMGGGMMMMGGGGGIDMGSSAAGGGYHQSYLSSGSSSSSFAYPPPPPSPGSSAGYGGTGGIGGYQQQFAPAAVASSAVPAAPAASSSSSSASRGRGASGGKITASSWKEVSDQVRAICLSQQQDELQNRSYQREYGQELATTIGERCLLMIRELLGEEQFKLSISSVIQERKDTALHLVSTNFFDPSTDGSCTSKYENKSLVSIVVVYGIKAA